MRTLFHLVAAAVLAGASPASAHYNMLLPSSSSGKKGEAVTFTYQWGHPYEHQLFDAPKPTKVAVRTPDGKLEDVTARLEQVALDGDKGKAAGWRFAYTPQQRGDFVFVLQAAPVFLEEDCEFVEDTVKVVLHVQAQKGWEALTQGDFEWEPLTRPYGLEPGMAFQARIDNANKLAANPFVEVERYNETPPKKLPPEEHMTRVSRPGPNGVVTCTLTDAGWWCLTTARAGGKRLRDGKEVPVRQRATLWVFVDEKAK